jgi:hypothetical protein
LQEGGSSAPHDAPGNIAACCSLCQVSVSVHASHGGLTVAGVFPMGSFLSMALTGNEGTA